MTMPLPTALDQLLIKPLAQNGTPLATRRYLNFTGTVTCNDNPNFVDPSTGEIVGATDVSLSGSGGGQNPATLSNGLNSNIGTNNLPTVRLAGPTGAFSVGGFALNSSATPGAGQALDVTNTTAQPMTVVHEDVGSTAAYRITVGQGVPVTIPAGGKFRLVYNGASSRWELQGSGLIYQPVVNLKDFGADPTGAVDCSTAVSDWLAYGSALGAELRAPAGTYTLHGLFALPGGTRLTGDAGPGTNALPGTIFSFTSGGFTIAATHITIENVLVLQGTSAGPTIDVLNSGNPAHIYCNRFCIMNSNTGLPMIRVGSSASPSFLIFARFSNCKWTHATGATVPGVEMFGADGDLNSVDFDHVWFQSDATASAPCFDIEGQTNSLGGAGTFSISFDKIVFETPKGGAIKLRSAYRCSLRRVLIADLNDAQTAHLIDIDKDSTGTHSPPSGNIEIVGLQSDSGNSTHQTIYFDGTVGGQGEIILIACDAPHVGNNGPTGNGNTYYALACNIGGFSGDAPWGWDGVTQTASAFSGNTMTAAGQIEAESAGYPIAMRSLVGSTSTAAALYSGANLASPTANNAALQLFDTASFLSGTSQSGLLVNGSAWLRAYLADNESLACVASDKPIVGDSVASSPYGVHGVGVQSMNAGGTVVAGAGVFKNGIIRLTGNPGGSVTLQLPLGIYAKLIDNQTSGTTITVQGPTGSGVTISTGKVWVYCDGTNFS